MIYLRDLPKLTALLFLFQFPFAVQASQTASTSQTVSTSQTAAQAPDPLSEGKGALKRGDYAAAKTVFAAYLKDNPNNADALAMAGDASLGLQAYEDAAQSYVAAIKLQPTLWSAHKNLVIAYAAEGKWAEFDQERSLLQGARANGAPGLSSKDADVIDVFYVGAERYIVRSYAELTGRYKTRYNFTHFGADGKLDFWIACESDDVDQSFFAKAHPKEAAAGQRSFSLDSYTPPKPSADGRGYTETHGTIKFYPDGEPTYETVRSDVMKTLDHQLGAMSSTTSGIAATPETTSPKSK